MSFRLALCDVVANLHVDTTPNVDPHLEVDTLPSVFSVPLLPEKVDRLALHTKKDQHGHKICGQRDDDGVTNECEIARNFRREDAKV